MEVGHALKRVPNFCFEISDERDTFGLAAIEPPARQKSEREGGRRLIAQDTTCFDNRLVAGPEHITGERAGRDDDQLAVDPARRPPRTRRSSVSLEWAIDAADTICAGWMTRKREVVETDDFKE